MRLGIIGSNFISHRLLEAAKDLGDKIQPFAILSRREETGRAFAEGYPGMQVFTDREAFFRCGIQGVYIATPNALHCQGAVAALEAGLHVLCEKPFCASLAEAQRMLAAADKAGKVILEAMRPVHDPAWAAIKEALGEIGPLRSVSLEYCQYSSRYDRFLQGEVLNAFQPALANAAVMDIGVYPLHVALYLFGMPKRLEAASVFLKNGFEGAGSVLALYEDFTLNVLYSKISQSVAPSVFLGEKGSITVDKISSPERILLKTRSGEERLLPTRERENNMDYELADFLTLAAECDKARKEGIAWKDPYRAITLQEAALLDKIREKAGIRFE